ncbi:MAG: FIST C-terminal domain-containing protein [Bacteroidales bacterium]|nr:FIST C-terminal domain-containing protein [Bacteroidales bacterium]
MEIHQIILREDTQLSGMDMIPFTPDLLLIFGSRELLKTTKKILQLREMYPNAVISGCSTSGEIKGVNIHDETIVVNAIKFESSQVVIFESDSNVYENVEKVGEKLVNKFNTAHLKHLFVLSDGLNVNGSELVKGLRKGLRKPIGITGGMASDGNKMEETYVIGNDGFIHSNWVSIIGFYGESLKVGYGSCGGWDSFGIDRMVTKSYKNILYEIDNEPALDLYKFYLGDRAKELPSAGLFFPLSIRTSSNSKPLVRTIIDVDEKKRSLTFAGNIPQGSYVKLMKANQDRIINGAEMAALSSIKSFENEQVQLAILISCIGRRLVLKQLVEDEIDVVSQVLGEKAVITGFYSYGEIAPFEMEQECDLHNQTMTVAIFSEIS